MANEFKVKNGIKFSDGTVQTTAASGAGTVSVDTSDTPPASPVDGTLWWDSSQGQLYIYYQDAESAQWVQALVSAPISQGNSSIGFEQTFLLMGA